MATSDAPSAVFVEGALDVRLGFQKESRSASTLANGEMGAAAEVGVDVPEDVGDTDCIDRLSPFDVETEGGC
jgi:hypothetical protein